LHEPSQLEEVESKIRALVEQGHGIRYIGTEVGMSKSTVFRRVRELGLRTRGTYSGRSPNTEVRGSPVNPDLETIARFETDTTRPSWNSGQGRHEKKEDGLVILGIIEKSKPRSFFDMIVYPEISPNQEVPWHFYQNHLARLRGHVVKADIGLEFSQRWREWMEYEGVTICLVRGHGGISKPAIEALWADFKRQYSAFLRDVRDCSVETRLLTCKWAIAKYKEHWARSGQVTLTSEEETIVRLPLFTSHQIPCEMTDARGFLDVRPRISLVS
jgi:hypothetical protein